MDRSKNAIDLVENVQITTYDNMLAHILLDVRVQLTVIEGLKCATTHCKWTLNNAMLTAEVPWRKSTRSLQVLIYVNRRKDVRAALRSVRARSLDIFYFTRCKIVRKQVADWQLLVVAWAAWIWFPENQSSILSVRTTGGNVLHFLSYFSQDVMHFLQNRWPQVVSCGSCNQFKQMAHSKFGSIQLASSYFMYSSNDGKKWFTLNSVWCMNFLPVLYSPVPISYVPFLGNLHFRLDVFVHSNPPFPDKKNANAKNRSNVCRRLVKFAIKISHEYVNQ